MKRLSCLGKFSCFDCFCLVSEGSLEEITDSLSSSNERSHGLPIVDIVQNKLANTNPTMISGGYQRKTTQTYIMPRNKARNPASETNLYSNGKIGLNSFNDISRRFSNINFNSMNSFNTGLSATKRNFNSKLQIIPNQSIIARKQLQFGNKTATVLPRKTYQPKPIPKANSKKPKSNDIRKFHNTKPIFLIGNANTPANTNFKPTPLLGYTEQQRPLFGAALQDRKQRDIIQFQPPNEHKSNLHPSALPDPVNPFTFSIQNQKGKKLNVFSSEKSTSSVFRNMLSKDLPQGYKNNQTWKKSNAGFTTQQKVPSQSGHSALTNRNSDLSKREYFQVRNIQMIKPLNNKNFQIISNIPLNIPKDKLLNATKASNNSNLKIQYIQPAIKNIHNQDLSLQTSKIGSNLNLKKNKTVSTTKNNNISLSNTLQKILTILKKSNHSKIDTTELLSSFIAKKKNAIYRPSHNPALAQLLGFESAYKRNISPKAGRWDQQVIPAINEPFDGAPANSVSELFASTVSQADSVTGRPGLSTSIATPSQMQNMKETAGELNLSKVKIAPASTKSCIENGHDVISEKCGDHLIDRTYEVHRNYMNGNARDRLWDQSAMVHYTRAEAMRNLPVIHSNPHPESMSNLLLPVLHANAESSYSHDIHHHNINLMQGQPALNPIPYSHLIDHEHHELNNMGVVQPLYTHDISHQDVILPTPRITVTEHLNGNDVLQSHDVLKNYIGPSTTMGHYPDNNFNHLVNDDTFGSFEDMDGGKSELNAHLINQLQDDPSFDAIEYKFIKQPHGLPLSDLTHAGHGYSVHSFHHGGIVSNENNGKHDGKIDVLGSYTGNGVGGYGSYKSDGDTHVDVHINGDALDSIALEKESLHHQEPGHPFVSDSHDGHEFQEAHEQTGGTSEVYMHQGLFPGTRMHDDVHDHDVSYVDHHDEMHPAFEAHHEDIHDKIHGDFHDNRHGILNDGHDFHVDIHESEEHAHNVNAEAENAITAAEQHLSEINNGVDGPIRGNHLVEYQSNHADTAHTNEQILDNLLHPLDPNDHHEHAYIGGSGDKKHTYNIGGTLGEYCLFTEATL